MRNRFVCATVAALSVAVVGAQSTNDPRVGLKAGLHDAGEAIRGLERVASLSNPSGFFDPKQPPGAPTPAEPPPNAPPPDPNAPPDPRFANMLAFANSDLAFSGTHLFMGSFHGFNTFDIERPTKPKLAASIVCPGGQGDVSVHGNLLFMSVEQTRGRLDCGVQGVPTPVSAERFRGIRVFDISDLNKPKQVAAIQTCRGSHTHTLVPDAKDPDNLYVYGSGTSSVRAGEELTGCSGAKPEEDPNTALFSIDVIKVPLAHPEQAAIVNKPRIFADPSGRLNGLWNGGDHGEGTQKTSVTNQCHDITVFPEMGLAAGACSGNGILLDIHDPVHPVRLDDVSDKNFAYWHSATFNNDGTKVLFTDEWGGGGRPRCRAVDPPNWGADAIFEIVDGKKLRFAGYYKLPAVQTEQENCVAHNGSLVPVPGRDIMVQAWYQGGVSMFDFTDPSHPVEIAFFDRGPIDGKQLVTGGYWSAYWYNGQIYGSEIARGLDVFRLKPSELLSQNEIDAATLVRSEETNTQLQTKIAWPASAPVALAYVDQLTRAKSIQADRARAVKTAFERADSVRNGDQKAAATAAEQLDSLARQFDADAGSASGANATRMKALSATLKGRAAKLRG